MASVKLREAIAGGHWYDCTAERYNESLHFKVRVVAFSQTSAQEIDPDSEEEFEGDLWLLKIEVVNLDKRPVEVSYVRDVLELEDDEGYVFQPFTATDLDLDRESGLLRLSGGSGTPLSPKLKASGAVLFVLPQEDSEYSLSIQEGSITRL